MPGPVTRRTHALLFLAISFASLALEACSRARRETTPAPHRPAVLVVENRDPKDLTIYGVRISQRLRIGSVAGLSSASFELPSALLEPTAGTVRFQADPTGATERLTSELVAVRPGNRVEWTIELGLRRNMLAVF
jgi:hypothetical protein